MNDPMYYVDFAPRTEDQLKKIPKDLQKLILKRIEKLGKNPRPHGAEPLHGSDVGLFLSVKATIV